jgi:TRAP-type mannitol/chloroaromatic compound transport system permease large subunit
MGATGALVLALANRRLDWNLLRQAMDKTAN